MKGLNFTKENLLKLPVPINGRDYYQDIKEKGLNLYITSNGSITFFIRKKVNKQDKKIIIGHFPNISVSDARKAAFEIKAKLAKIKKPLEDKIFNETTFEMIFEEYMIKHSKKNIKTWKDDERNIKRFAASLFTRSASSITKNELITLHQKIGDENGTYQANRFLDRMKSIFNKAIEWGHKLENPTIGIKKFKEIARDRFLQANELESFWKALHQESNTIIRDYILVSLFTGARKSNVCSMKWNQIDFYTRIWRIPETKNGDTLSLPISDKIIEILQFRKEDNEKLGFKNSEYVFPGKGITGHLVEPKKSWKNILNKAGIKDLRLHDLRRTFGSWQAINGTSMQVIGKSLGHKSSSATEIYARLSIDPVRESVTKVTELILNIASGNIDKNKK